MFPVRPVPLGLGEVAARDKPPAGDALADPELLGLKVVGDGGVPQPGRTEAAWLSSPWRSFSQICT